MKTKVFKYASLIMLVMVVLVVVAPTPVYASGQFKDWATGYAVQGNTEVYYSSPTLVKVVQAVISWLCIIAFLCYYASYLCSIVVLSNKELFYTIDTLKRDTSNGGGGKSGGIFNTVMNKFKEGGGETGLNGGFDNIVVFLLTASINFKALSVYKNVEAGDGAGDDGGKGTKFTYGDTILSFFLKSLGVAVGFTVVLSLALSGILIRTWFTLGDVAIVKADRFSQMNLVAMIDSYTGNDSLYHFTLDISGTKGGAIAQGVAKSLYSQIIAKFPDMTLDQYEAIGFAVEEAVWNDTGTATGAANSILGGDDKGYESLYDLASANMAGEKIPLENFSSEEAMNSVTASVVTLNTNPSTNGDKSIVFSVDSILRNAGYVPPSGDTNSYAHVSFSFNKSTYKNFLTGTETQ